MHQKPDHIKRYFLTTALVVAGLGIACAVGYWWFFRQDENGPLPQPEETQNEKVVSDFYTALAALDVEENQMAAKTLTEAVELAPEEPALWANLAVAQMRLREMEAAEESLNKALKLAEDSRELALLRAEVLEHSGQVEAAIEQLRQVHEIWPENLAATFSLVSLLGQFHSEESEVERLALLSEILERASGNLRARTEQARIAATLERRDELRTAVNALLADQEKWPQVARQQLEAADKAAKAGDFPKAALSLTFFENLVKPTPSYQQALAELGTTSAGVIGTPLRSFLRLKLPSSEVADADVKLTFKLQDALEGAENADLVLALAQPADPGVSVLLLSENTLRVGEAVEVPFPDAPATPHRSNLGIADLNFDFRQDLILAGTDGVRVLLAQQDGSFQPASVELDEFNKPWKSVWTMDVDADGDIDLLLSDHKSSLRWIRNNGDMTFSAMSDFVPVTAVLDLQAVDLDGDGDVDLVTADRAGTVSVWNNQRGGKFLASPAPFADSQRAIAVGDVDRDGQFDLVSLSASGEVSSATWRPEGKWERSQLVKWPHSDSLAEAKIGEAFLFVEDIDNNGGVDLIVSLPDETRLWLRTAEADWAPLEATPKMWVSSLADINRDGLMDLIGQVETDGKVALNQSQAGYGWQVVKPRAAARAGDKRINSFGIGGRITVRAGPLVQSSAIHSPRVHFGLGRHDQADVARIIWPNGTIQAEFRLPANHVVSAEQRLKGSCPWVFAYDGTTFRFVKDFLWRSPLGLKINAQTTAGITQTEDWIKIPGSLLAETDGRHQVRITAELWETHFFDQVGLLAVDHPSELEIYVDERFVPTQPPSQKVIAATKPKALENVANHQGRSLNDYVRTIDETYADQFALGEYQGVAEEHWIAFTLPKEVVSDRPVLIVGHGWIYPTDSSLNVALGQRQSPRPHSLILEQQTPEGNWKTLNDNLGSPAGKNKDVLIELPMGALEVSRRFRLRTNMEIYWDALAWSYALENADIRVNKLPTALAELRQRGYSNLKPVARRRPDTPLYEVEAVGQRWLDLEGYYTRFGDVRELLAETDDRYVIMNAGDELVFEFQSEAKLPTGWQRDFVLIGDGWVKDGDFNTAFSQWVRPLPSHNEPNYKGPLRPLTEDSVYQRHNNDWQIYHTRYVSPRHSRQRLWEMTNSLRNSEFSQ